MTPRELEVLTLTAQGLTHGEVGRQLYITENTVRTHLRHTFAYLQARNSAHAVALALTAGLIPAPRTPGDPL